MARVTLRQLVAKYFPPEEVDNALAIIELESGGNPKARNVVTNPPPGYSPEDSRGLFQVNALAHGQQEDLFDPETNVRKAYEIWKSKGGRWIFDWRDAAQKLKLVAPGDRVPSRRVLGDKVIVDAGEDMAARPQSNSWQAFIKWATDNDYIDLDPDYYKSTGVSYNQLVDYLWSEYGDQFARETGVEKPTTSYTNRWQPGQMPGGGALSMGPPGEGEVVSSEPSIWETGTRVVLGGISELIRNASGQKSKTPGEVITEGQYATGGEYQVPEGPIATAAKKTNILPSTIKAAVQARQAGAIVTIEDIIEAQSRYGAKAARDKLTISMNQIRANLVKELLLDPDAADVDAQAEAQIKMLYDNLNDEVNLEQQKQFALFQNSLKSGAADDKTMSEYQAAMVQNANAQLALQQSKFDWDKEHMSPAEAAAASTSKGRLEFDIEREKYGRENLTAAEKAAQEASKATTEARKAELEQRRVEEKQRIKEAMDTSRLRALDLITNARQRATQMYGEQARYALAPGQQYAIGWEPGGIASRLGLPSVGQAQTIPFNAFEGVGQAQSELEKILAGIAGWGG